MDPDPDPGGPKICESCRSGSATLLTSDFLVSKSDLDGEFLLTVVLLDEELALLQQTQLNKQETNFVSQFSTP
jgi:hypothetical protein